MNGRCTVISQDSGVWKAYILHHWLDETVSVAWNRTKAGMTDVRLPVVATAGERRRKLFCFQPLALHLWDEGVGKSLFPPQGIQVFWACQSQPGCSWEHTLNCMPSPKSTTSVWLNQAFWLQYQLYIIGVLSEQTLSLWQHHLEDWISLTGLR